MNASPETPVKHTFSAKQDYMLKNDFRLTKRKDSYHTVTGYHHHDFYEVYILISGTITYAIEQKIYHLQSGDILIINTKELHRPLISPDSREIERMILSINPQLLTALPQSDLDLSQCFYSNTNEGHNLLHPDPEMGKQIMDILNRMLACRSDHAYGSAELARLYFTELMIMLNRVYLLQTEGLEALDTSYNVLIRSVIRYITEHIDEDLSLDTLSSAFFVSKFHLSREFKRCTGSTIHRFITQKRLAISKELIRQGIPIMQIYPLCGFTEYSVFLKAFKQEYQMTPKQFESYINQK